MKFALLLLAALEILGVCVAYSVQPTLTPCPKVCPYLYAPVCVRDRHGDMLLSFTNPCMKRMCECRIKRIFEEVDMDRCKEQHPEPPRDLCPVWLRSQEGEEGQEEGSQQDSSSSSSDSESESQD